MFKVVVAGSRNFDMYEVLCDMLDYYLSNQADVEIVSGTANGADKLGECYAKERGYSLKLFPADWDTYGKRAGYLRNEEMANYCDAVVVFWDGKSKGTAHMIDLAKKANKKLKIVRFKPKLIDAKALEKLNKLKDIKR